MKDIPSAGALDLSKEIRTIWAWRWIVLSAVLIAGLLGLAISSTLRPIYESEVGITVGRVSGGPIEDPYALARYLESSAFRTEILGEGDSAISVEVVEGAGGPRAAVYVKVTAAALSGDAARALAGRTLDACIQRHRERYEAIKKQYTEYGATLERQIQALTDEISQSDALLKSLNANDFNGISRTTLLVHAQQLTSKQEVLLMYAKELRDSRIHQLANTQPTAGVGPPTNPAAPVWPRRFVVAIVAAAVAFILLVSSILVVSALRRPVSDPSGGKSLASVPQVGQGL